MESRENQQSIVYINALVDKIDVGYGENLMPDDKRPCRGRTHDSRKTFLNSN